MKKFFVFLMTAVIGFSVVSAQNLTLKANGTVVAEGSTIEFRGVFDGWSPLTCYLEISNTSDKDIDVRVEFSRDGLPVNATAMICGFGRCSSEPFTEGVVKANSTVGAEHDMDIAYTPNENLDEFVTSVELTNKTDNEKLKFKIRFIPSPSAANNRDELAGVRVYPNPSTGVFSLDVPERAQVEIFAVNGQLVRQMEVMAGKTAVQIDRNGVYFMRVRANGKTAVKRIVIG